MNGEQQRFSVQQLCDDGGKAGASAERRPANEMAGVSGVEKREDGLYVGIWGSRRVVVALSWLLVVVLVLAAVAVAVACLCVCVCVL